jgi:hypothetical protein
MTLVRKTLVQYGIEAANSTTTAPIAAGFTDRPKPEFLRLPKAGTLCPYSGLARSKMNELILPCAANDFRPPVASVSLRNRGQIKAVRLIVYDSLMTYLRSFMENGGGQ